MFLKTQFHRQPSSDTTQKTEETDSTTKTPKRTIRINPEHIDWQKDRV